MYPGIKNALETLIPRGFQVIVRIHGTGLEKPDISLANADGAPVTHIEVKLHDTLRDAFRVTSPSTQSQISRYRQDGLPVLLTDATRWYDVTRSDDISRPLCTFTDVSETSDRTAEAQLKSFLFASCGIRPRYGIDTAVAAISGVIGRISSAHDEPLNSGWEIVREGLDLTIDDDSLDPPGVGELVAFTLLSIAAGLDTLPDSSFVSAAIAEWDSTSSTWDAAAMPVALGATLRLFRDEDRRLSGTLLGADAWATIRGIAAWVNSTTPADRWLRLSSLWDTYLQTVGRRRTLGSWQTPHGVADYQALQVASALRDLGYVGLHDSAVTVIDPCCGTGVYLESVVRQAISDGGSAEAFNSPTHSPGYPRLLGTDISSTAIAAAHIRISNSGARPALYMTDTLATGASGHFVTMFDTGHGSGANPIVAAARTDYEEMQQWASRDATDRDPIIAVIGNPPYLRAGLNRERYQSMGWWRDVLERWRVGSGGQGGGVMDLFAAFWAWALMLCSQRHPSFDTRVKSASGPVGVVSFITNRSLIEGRTFSTMRAFILAMNGKIEVTDFGPGSRAGGAGGWSTQPFQIETGTAIVTVTLGAGNDASEVRYRRATWTGTEVVVEDPQPITPRVDTATRGRRTWASSQPWLPVSTESVLSTVTTVNGIVTGNDAEWVSVDGDREYSLRHAYRPFDNRWIPSTPPPKARRGVPVPPGYAPASAWWREDVLFDPHEDFVKTGGWYLVAQFDRALPGPAFHATKRIPNHHLFKGSQASRILRVGPGVEIPFALRDWASRMKLDAPSFWLYSLAASHANAYWQEGTEESKQLAEKRVTPTFSESPEVVAQLVQIGAELVNVWDLDAVQPVTLTGGPGHWTFEGHNPADEAVFHGRRVLATWREARQGTWTRFRAVEYARSVAAVLRVRQLADDVTEALTL